MCAFHKKKPLDPTQRAIPRNPKYEHVTSVIDTGASISKVEQITTREYLKRRDEPFKRVKPQSLYQLLVEYSEEAGGDADAGGGAGSAVPDPDVPVTPYAPQPTPPKPFLLLDSREPEEFEVCHITEALNFPARLLNRDRLTPELYHYKNREGSMIVLYDNDERVAAPLAVRFLEKGFDNVYLLSGGMRVVGNKFPLLLDGELPAELVMKPPKSRHGSSSSSRRAGSIAGDDASVMSSVSSPTGRRGPGSVSSRRTYR